MTTELFSHFLAELVAWTGEPPPCIEPQKPDGPGVTTKPRQAALISKVISRLAAAEEQEAGGTGRDLDLAEVAPTDDEDDDAFFSDPVRY